MESIVIYTEPLWLKGCLVYFAGVGSTYIIYLLISIGLRVHRFLKS